MNKDTLQTVARMIVKMIAGWLVIHGALNANQASTPMAQTIMEELAGGIVSAVSLWWSKKHQVAIAATGNTQTFTKAPSLPTPAIPPTPPPPSPPTVT